MFSYPSAVDQNQNIQGYKYVSIPIDRTKFSRKKQNKSDKRNIKLTGTKAPRDEERGTSIDIFTTDIPIVAFR